jgi:exodeoxyribonuclease VII large subunit
VGHETDFSISDFVADLRAPTPTAAAELSTPDGGTLNEQFRRLARQLKVRIGGRIKTENQRLDHTAHRLEQVHPRRRLEEQRRQLTLARGGLHREMVRKLGLDTQRLVYLGRQLEMLHPQRTIDSARDRLRVAASNLGREFKNILASRREQIGGIAAMLNAVSPLQTVGRGYALLTVAGTAELVTRRADVPSDGKITAQVADGRLFCTVDDSDEGCLTEQLGKRL